VYFGVASPVNYAYVLIMIKNTADQKNSAGPKLDFPATARNQDAILGVLQRILPDQGHVLEIASGSGQHAAFFAAAFPNLIWQTSDPDPEHRVSIDAWAKSTNLSNPPALHIDVLQNDWLVKNIDAIVTINMIHIAPWACCQALIKQAAELLPEHGVLYFYGPFKIGGNHTADSNQTFDISLKNSNPEWGVRNLDDVAETALNAGFQLAESVPMPANNFSIIFRRKAK